MTVDEGRALFPVLERIAYLNAGTNGPLRERRPSRRCTPSSIGSSPRDGPAQWFLDRATELRDRRARAAGGAARESTRASSRSPPPRPTAATSSSAGSASDRTTRWSRPTPSTSGSSARCTHQVRGSSSCLPSRSGILAAVGPRTRLVAVSHVIWTTGVGAPGRRAARALGRPDPRRRRAVRRRGAGERAECRLLHGVGPEMALRAGRDGRPLRRRSGTAARRAPELPLASRACAGRELRAARGRGALRAELVCAARCWRGSPPRSTRRRSGATTARRR